MGLYYLHKNKGLSNAFLNSLNGHSYFNNGGIVGNTNGQPNPSSQRTDKWCNDSIETVNGDWVVPVIPENHPLHGLAETAAIENGFNTEIVELDFGDLPPIYDDEFPEF